MKKGAPMKRRLSAGFTLIEMMVVIVILGVLATVLVINFQGRDDKAKQQVTKTVLESISNQIEMFKMDHNQYPQSLNDLRQRPSYVEDTDWTNSYLKKSAKDGWGRDLHYDVPGPGGHPFKLYSLGRDDQVGGTGFDTDLSNIEEIQ
jgi:general secretion pathway protein G